MKIKYIVLSFICSFCLLFSFGNHIVHADQWSTDLNNVSSDSKQEFYYWDGNNIVSMGGRYSGKITWYPQSQNGKKFNVQGDWIKIRPGTVNQDEPDKCTSLPATGRADGGIQFVLHDDEGKNGATLDVIGDGSNDNFTQEDGHLKWGGKRSNGWNVIGSAINQATNNRECQYHLYDGFNKRVSPYKQDYIIKSIPYAGHLLGQKGMKFDEWAKRSDRRNIYAAYEKAAGNDIVSHCQGKDNTPDCVNKLKASFERCYAKAVGSSAKQVEKDNLNSKDWQNDLDTTILKDCMVDDKSTDPFFSGDKGDWVQRMMEDGNANIPPSIAPKLPGEDDLSVTEKTHCSIAKIGWIMCPILDFFSKLNDKIYGILQNWLYVNPFYADGGTNKTDASYKIWIQMRNVANVTFVLALMIIVYSYLSGQGVSNYNIRKMTPRLIITAILVNASFIICALAVDLSNVAGDSVYRIIQGMSTEANTGVSQFSNWETVTTSIVMAGGAVAASVATLANLAALVPLLVTALLAMVTTFVVLLLRQAIIILLVVVSPLAFAMFLLPNTKKWFDRWRSTFVTLLLLYPAVALIFAGSYFASRIILTSATENGQVLLALFSLGIQTIPLFITPLLIKLSGGVLNRFGGIINNPNKGPFDRMKKKANQFRDDRKQLQQTRAMNGAKGVFGVYGGLQRREARRKYKLQYHQSERDRAQAKMAGSDENSRRIGNMVAGRTSGNDELNRAIQNRLQEEARQLHEDDTRVAGVLIENELFNNENAGLMDDIANRAATGRDSNGNTISEAERSAAIQKVVQNRDIDEIHRLVRSLNSMSRRERDTFADAMESSGIGNRAAHLGTEEAYQRIRNGTATVDNLYADAANRGVYTASTAAVQDHKVLTGLRHAYENGAISTNTMDQVQAEFNKALSNQKTSQHISQASRDIGSRLNAPLPGGGRR